MRDPDRGAGGSQARPKALWRRRAYARSEGVGLTLFYFDVETTGGDPQQDQLVCAQYQQLSDALEPVGPFQVVAEWEWGEEQGLQGGLAKGLLAPTRDFVPA